MQTEKVEYNDLSQHEYPLEISGCLWEDKKKIVHKTITDALEAWFDQNQEQVEFRLAPLDGKLYVIRSEEQEVIPEPTKRYNIYGDPS